MKGRIVSFRRSRHVTRNNQMIIVADSVDNKEKAEKLIGKTVVYKPLGKQKKELKGKISAAHGGNGAFRAIFETGMPGQAITKDVEII